MKELNNMFDNKFWRIWAKAIGPKEGSDNKEADMIALIRTVLLLLGLMFSVYGAVTNTAIILGIERHWGGK